MIPAIHNNHKIMLLEQNDISAILPKRDKNSHKGCYGHVLVVGGDYGMAGAVRMAAEAAARVGAGLVSVATRPEHAPIINSTRPELMCHSIAVADDLIPLVKRATVLVIGPGLGKSTWSKSLFELLIQSDLPMVVDADGLNLLSESPRQKNNWILTPHMGEAARLLNIPIKEVENDRFQAVERLQQQYQGVAILKGAGTLIKTHNETPRMCSAGNPGMASGGMGDVLSGVIAGLLAQKLSLSHAAEIGVLVHALAADRAAASDGERGLLASDLFPHLRYFVNLSVSA